MMKRQFVRSVVFAIFLVSTLLLCIPANSATWYVDVDAAAGGGGGSWPWAFNDLQSALDMAVVDDEIWVAAGIYKPTVEHGGAGARWRSFQMKRGVVIYGGFDPSVGDTSLSDRDWVNNETILSGDIGTAGSIADNCYHVFFHPDGTDVDITAILDGFTIADGNSIGSGAGMYNYNCILTVNNCTFLNNQAANWGGGMYNEYAAPWVTNCTFSGNTAGVYGGGMYNRYSFPYLINSTFVNNSAATGGGVSNYGSTHVLYNCIFAGNRATGALPDHGAGGGMDNRGGSSPSVNNCTFYGNEATNWGGGISNKNLFTDPVIVNSIFWANTAGVGDQLCDDGWADRSVTYCAVQGGHSGMGNIDSDPLFMDPANGDFHLQTDSPCIDAGDNSASLHTTDFEGDPRIYPTVGGTVDMGVDEYLPYEIWVDDNYSAGGPNDGHTWGYDAFDNIQEAIDIVHRPGTVHVAPGVYLENVVMDSGVHLMGVGAGSNTATDSIIDGGGGGSTVTAIGVDATALIDGFAICNGNTATGGGMYTEGAYLTVSNCLFENNVASDSGGGMYNWNSSPIVNQCDFFDNTAADDGGGIYNGGGSPTLIACAFNGNQAQSALTVYSGGGGIYNSYSSTTVMSCTFTNNSGGNGGGGMYNWISSSVEVTGATFSENSADDGGGMFNYDSSLTVIDTRFNNNSAIGYGTGGGMYNRNGRPRITHCTFEENTAWSGGGMHNQSASPEIDRCVFKENSAVGGGGISNYDSSDPIVTSCVFFGNLSYIGSGMANDTSSPAISGCTFTKNVANEDSYGAGMYNANSSAPRVNSSIFWGDTPDEFYSDLSSSPVVTYSDVEGAILIGIGNISRDPLFADPDDGDIHLMPDSPCIDRGDFTIVSRGSDFEGDERILDGNDDGSKRMDMGADELVLDGDGDGIQDDIDMQPVVFSNVFTDTRLIPNGTTVGTITERGNQLLMITEVPNPVGVRIRAGAAGGTRPAEIDACDGVAPLSLTPGDQILLTCGSTNVKVIGGNIEFKLNQTDLISVPAGSEVTLSQSGQGGVEIENSGNSGIVQVTYLGQVKILTPGQEMVLSLTCPGDHELDWDVDGSDLAEFAIDYAGADETADLNGDGLVDSEDVKLFAESFGNHDCH